MVEESNGELLAGSRSGGERMQLTENEREREFRSCDISDLVKEKKRKKWSI